ncbi:A/G-specific adenine glycosylase [Aquabacterium lacunae]|uniref:Adenine DNA glycosylase n=1 Tax=Aquabacterium lacunae TaxID=2528630 RepID=A0A4Q9H2V0_9BURK|nr:A/G-specific adenine glycosylase [Aquabacterium lacunae]TBO34559.1 A/G-specific adenine glycosylase [Aquabacterium lacunae]
MGPTLSERLVTWQRQHGRHHLPWQNTRDPYRVWLSEIMLQQTQVSTVLGYYDRFLALWPTVADLAAASLDEVLAQWAGLGYYSRARNLHRCAQAVVSAHGGTFPRQAEVLATLPGIGRSTAAAIAGFCFDERVTILDGNVKRVLTRALNWEGDLSVTRHERWLWDAASLLVPEQGADMPAYTQGLMDLGATVCTPRKPQCLLCPWQPQCLGLQAGRAAELPVKTRKLKRSRRESWCLWIEQGGQTWVAQRPDTGVWAGLWTFPMWASEGAALRVQQALQPERVDTQPPITHVLTHLDWVLHLSRLSVPAQVDVQAVLQASQAADPVAAMEPVAAGPSPRSAEGMATLGFPAPFQRWLTGR